MCTYIYIYIYDQPKIQIKDQKTFELSLLVENIILYPINGYFNNIHIKIYIGTGKIRFIIHTRQAIKLNINKIDKFAFLFVVPFGADSN